MGKNKTIPSGERTLILRVLHFFEEEKKKGSPLLPLKKALSRTSTATGVSLSTITRIKKEELKILEEMSLSTACEAGPEEITSSTIIPKSRPEVVLPTPGKKRRPAYNKLKIDEFTISAIKNIVNDFYKEKNELPTLKKILAVAKADFNFPGQKETLRKILREKCGYTFTKCMKKSNLLRGGNEIGFWRARNSKSKEKKQFADKKHEKIKNEKKDVNNLIDNEHDRLNTTEDNQNNLSKTENHLSEVKNELFMMNNVIAEMKNVQNELYQDKFSNDKNEHNPNHNLIETNVTTMEMQLLGSDQMECLNH